MSNDKTAKGQVISGLVWTFAERICAQLVSTIVGIVLARLLSPESYGIISIVMVFITLCNVFVTSGLGTAIVQKKEACEHDYNTAFSLSFTISLLLYWCLFLLAPGIAVFYDIPELTMVIRVLGIRIIISSMNTVQQAVIQRTMQFKKYFLANVSGTLISGIIGVIMAINGFGVWALVAQYLINTFIGTAVMFFVCKWKPRFGFSFERAKNIFSFGWKVLCTDLLWNLDSNVRSLLVGKVFGTADLAYYDQGQKYPALIMNNINASIQKVLLPTFSRMQDNLDSLRNALRRSVRMNSYVLAPLLLGLLACAENFTYVVLTEKWLSAVPYLCVFCLCYLTRPIESACHQALLALGRSGLVFWIMLAINGTGLCFTAFAVFVLRNVFAIAVFSFVTTLISLICFLTATNIIVGYRLKEQISDIFPSLLLSGAMFIVVYFVGVVISLPRLITLLIQVTVGIIFYLSISALIKIEPYTYLLNTIKRRENV